MQSELKTTGSSEPGELQELKAELENVLRRVKELEDRIAIRELTARYNHAFDDVRSDEYGESFTEDGVLQLGEDGEPRTGRQALADFSREFGFGLVHSTVDPVIEIDGDRATQVCNLILSTRSSDAAPGSITISNTGRYRDDLVRTPEGWKFAKRVWFPDQASPDD